MIDWQLNEWRTDSSNKGWWNNLFTINKNVMTWNPIQLWFDFIDWWPVDTAIFYTHSNILIPEVPDYISWKTNVDLFMDSNQFELWKLWKNRIWENT